jgi:hypothetical protein
MSELKNLTVCFIDNGLFTDFAARAGRDFGRTLYWMPWVDGFPKSNKRLPGHGVPGLERIQYIWDHVDEIDLFVVLDVYFHDLQIELVRRGKKVWGPGRGESLELERWKTKQVLRELGLPVSKSVLIQSTENLREYVKGHGNVWVKRSTVRGDGETAHLIDYELAETWIDDQDEKLGAKKHIVEFIVEDNIPMDPDEKVVETGTDGWIIDGKRPKLGMSGAEIKDCGYLIVVKPESEFPDPLREVLDKLTPFFERLQYRGFFSTELRITSDMKPYLIDPTCRLGSPPSEIYQELFANWGEVLWAGAHGEVIEPEPLYKYGAEALIHSSFADCHWQSVRFPEEIRPYVKLRNHTIIEGVDYVVPQDCHMPEIGAVIGLGDTIEEAIGHLAENAAQVKGYYVDIKLDAIPKAIKEIQASKDMGMDLLNGDAMPEMEEVAKLTEV